MAEYNNTKQSKQQNKYTIEQIKKKINKLKGDRGTFETHWQEVADYFIPNRATITTKQYPGQKDAFKLLDNIGIQSNELLAGILHGLLTNTDSLWFEFTTGDLELDNNDEVRMYLQKVARILHNVLSNSNFHTEVHEIYLEIPSIGTGCMFIEEDDKRVIRAAAKPIENYYIDEDMHGTVNQVYYQKKMTAYEIIQEYGEKGLPDKILQCKDKDQKFEVTHAVYDIKCVNPSSKTKKFVSQHLLLDENYELREGQYHELPYITPRFSKRAGEIYGRSPAMTALPEMRVLNKMNETLLIGMQKQVDPPLQLEDDGVILPLVTRPGGINYRRAGAEPIQPLFQNTRIDLAYQALTERRQRVRDAFYVDQLRLSQDMRYMTATEVLQRTEDAMRLLGPLVGRMNAEFLRPLIDRVFRICYDRGMLPPQPELLQGRKVDVRYSSLIAKSQRVAEGQNITRTFELLAPVIQIDPTAVDHFNSDALVRIAAGILGFPQEALRSKSQIDNIRQQRAQAQQAMVAQAQQSAQTSQTVNDMATIAKARKDLSNAQG